MPQPLPPPRQHLFWDFSDVGPLLTNIFSCTVISLGNVVIMFTFSSVSMFSKPYFNCTYVFRGVYVGTNLNNRPFYRMVDHYI
jgi:hypothetical protein